MVLFSQKYLVPPIITEIVGILKFLSHPFDYFTQVDLIGIDTLLVIVIGIHARSQDVLVVPQGKGIEMVILPAHNPLDDIM